MATKAETARENGKKGGRPKKGAPGGFPASVESNATSTGGVTGKGFQPGESGNPGGRPKGFPTRIKELTGGEDYPKIAEGLAAIAFGTPAQLKKFFGEVVRVSARDRISAMVELRDSGPGRPVQTIHANQPVPLFALPGGTRPAFELEDPEP